MSCTCNKWNSCLEEFEYWLSTEKLVFMQKNEIVYGICNSKGSGDGSSSGGDFYGSNGNANEGHNDKNK